jgi:hypothetical protein
MANDPSPRASRLIFHLCDSARTPAMVMIRVRQKGASRAIRIQSAGLDPSGARRGFSYPGQGARISDCHHHQTTGLGDLSGGRWRNGSELRVPDRMGHANTSWPACRTYCHLVSNIQVRKSGKKTRFNSRKMRNQPYIEHMSTHSAVRVLSMRTPAAPTPLHSFDLRKDSQPTRQGIASMCIDIR